MRGAIGLEELSWPLLTLGLLMICVGVVVPGTQPEAVTVLILAGSSLCIIAILSPIYREFEIGLTKLRFVRGDGRSPEPWMIAKVETLEKIAREVLGDAELARSMVEEVLIAVRRVSRGIPRDGRDVMKLRTLVGQLYRADQERARGGGWQADGEPSGTMVALQALDFDTRVAYALSAQYRIKSVAEVMDISEGEASAQIERARDFVRANTATAGGPE